MRSDFIFFCPIRVRFGEVDSQGIVYNGNYCIYADVAFEEFLRFRGYPSKILFDQYDSDICHRKSTIEFMSSVFLDDMIEVGLRVIHIGNSSFTLGFGVFRQGEDDLLVSAEMVYVGYDTEKRCSRPLTDLMRQILSADK